MLQGQNEINAFYLDLTVRLLHLILWNKLKTTASWFQSGYYIPDAEVVREKYRVAVPQVENLEPFGLYIGSECQYFETYRLVRDDQPFGEYFMVSSEVAPCVMPLYNITIKIALDRKNVGSNKKL